MPWRIESYFDRPILTARQIDLPEVGPRFYKAVESVPIIENVEKFRSLTLDELDKVKLYLEKWNLASDTIFTATENDDGMIVGYVESFHGFFSVPDSKFPDFLKGFFLRGLQCGTGESEPLDRKRKHLTCSRPFVVQ